MLNLDTRQEIFGITVFQDSDRPHQFYYLPGNPHISYDRGNPLFDLYNYRKGGETGATKTGGFLNMTVDLSIGSLENRIKNRLQEQFGDEIRLGTVPFTGGEANVIALGEDSKALKEAAANETAAGGGPLVAAGPRFIQNILGSNMPSLNGDNRSIFSFSLSEDGAAFFNGLFDGSTDARPVGVVYQLDYIGLLPSYDLEITIDFKQVYEYMRSRFTLSTIFFKTDVDNIVEQLKKRESIQIKDVARTLELSTPEAVKERQQRIDNLVKELATGALFKPSLTPGEPKVKDETLVAEDPTATVSSSISEAERALRAGPSTAVAAGMGAALRVGESRGEAEDSSGSEDGDESGGNGGSTAAEEGENGGNGTEDSDEERTAADVWNKLGRPQAAYVYKTISQEEQRTVTYKLNQITAQKKTVAPQNFIQFMANRRDLDNRIHVIDLNHPFFQKINININALDVNFADEGIKQMTVQLRYGKRNDGSTPKDTAEAILRSPQDNKDFTFFMDRDLTQSYQYKLLVDYKDDFGIGVHDPRVESPWITTEARSLTVHPGWLSRTMPVSLQLAPNIPDDVNQVEVKVRYYNEEMDIDDSTLVRLDRENRERKIHIRLAAEHDQFEVYRKLYYNDGSSKKLPVLKLPDSSAGAADEVVVIDAPSSNLFVSDFIMLDPLGELQSVLVDIQVLQEENIIEAITKELNTPGKREMLSVRLDREDIPPRLLYKERRIYKDGGLEQGDWQEPITSNVIVGIPAEGTLNVTIHYMGPKPSSIKLNGIILDLEYRDPEGDTRFDQNTSLLITDNPETFIQEWVVRLPDRQARQYRWRLTLLHEDGQETRTEYNEDSRNLLVLRLP